MIPAAENLSTRTSKNLAAAFSDECRILLVGVGPHARRTYIPHLRRLADHHNTALLAVVDLEASRETVHTYAAEHDVSAELHFVPPFTDRMPPEVEIQLDRLADRLRINAVIISTEPLSHKAYALWALRRRLHIMMDKPITTRAGAVCDLVQAEGIAQDFHDLLKSYETLQRHRETCFLINSHRRFHPGFALAIQWIEEIRERTGCPVTSIASAHCDGQWRLPSEIVTQNYHSYNQGYGKVSHSGYHIIDLVYRFFKAGSVAGKQPDELEVFSSFVQPNGFLSQFHDADYHRIFGAEAYNGACRFSETEMKRVFSRFGEMDAAALLTLRRTGEAVAQAQINLRHNGVARRTWLQPGSDLYKGNGRIKHETHEITSGPFQHIVIESRQANDQHEHCDAADHRLGGNNHFELKRFRNCGVTGDAQPLEVVQLAELGRNAGFNDARLYTEQVKEAALLEFVHFVEGTLPKSALRSNIDDHVVPAQIMSATYASHVRHQLGENAVVSHPIGW